MATKTRVPNPTKNTLPEDMRSEVISQLNERLVLLVDLQIQAKQSHWNIKGPNFIGLHVLLDELAAAAEEYADLVAERAVQLGGIATGTVQVVAKTTALDDFPIRPITWKEHVICITGALAQVGDSVRNGIDSTDELGDPATADILTEVSRGLDMWLWKFESHLQD